MRHLFHLVDGPTWRAAVVTGEYRPASLADEGFVHFSFADQVAQTARRHYPDVPELLSLEVDPELLTAPVVVEDLTGSGEAFPHVYGIVPVRAVVEVRPFAPG